MSPEVDDDRVYDYDKDYDILFPKIREKAYYQQTPTGVTEIGRFCNCRERWERYDRMKGEPFEHRCVERAFQRIDDHEKSVAKKKSDAKERQIAELVDTLKKLLSALGA